MVRITDGPKSEIRSPNPERNPSFEFRKAVGPPGAPLQFGFRISAFGFLSGLGFRISDFHQPACALLVCLLASAFLSGAVASAASQTNAVPVIYCTDLFHPHVDPDDHFDLATLYGLTELDIKGIVLDQGDKQQQRPGQIPVSQMNRLTGRKVPVALGLGRKLASPSDRGLDQAPEYQGGVRLILDTLRASPRPVMIAAVGSLRDLAAAYNREPELFRAKAGKLLLFIGEASDPGFQEYNVGLDPQAYVGVMRSGLPVYWVPCFDGGLWQNRGHASLWQARHSDLLGNAAPGLVQYFIYALEKEQAEPLAFLSAPVDPRRKERLFAGTRNLWCAAIFGVLADEVVAAQGSGYALVPAGEQGGDSSAAALFGFSEVEIYVTDDAVVHYGHRADSKRVKRFDVRRPAQYAAGMTAVTARLLSGVGRRP